MTRRKTNKVMLVAALSVLMVLLASSALSAQGKSFTDVKGHWAEADIIAAADAAIINGYPDGSFKPEAQVIQQHFGFMLGNAGKSVKVDNDTAVTTRELAAKFLVIGFGLSNEAVDTDAVLAAYADRDQIKAENKKYVAIAVKNGLLTGFDAKTFAPQGTLTRAQAAAVILRAIKKGSAATKPAFATEYVGSETCKACHFDKYTEWKQTYHSKMIQDAKEDGSVIGNFDTLPDQSLRPLFENARFVQGSKWKQRYIIKGADGHYILPYQWNVAKQTWGPYNKDTWQTKTWEKLCIGCHTTGYNPDTNKYVEVAIGCEACHGAGKDHVVSRGDRTKIVKDVTVNVCASCHNRGWNEKGGEYSLGWKPGMPFTVDYLKLVQYPDKNVWAGGWAKGHHQQWQDWMLSDHAAAMDDLKKPGTYEYAKSKGYCANCHSVDYRLAPANAKPAFDELKDSISCNVCHTPHSPGKGAGQLRESRETTCTTCHTADITGNLAPGKTVRRADDIVAAGTGAIDIAVTPGVHYKNNVTCVDCHMTKFATSMNSYDISNHVFDAVTPIKAKELGLPTDSCSSCHKTSTPEIRQSYIDFWKGNTAAKLEAVNKLLAEAKAKVDANPNRAADVKVLYDKSVSNVSIVTGDRSQGIHNYEYTLKILGQAEKDLKAFLEKAK